MKLKDKLAQVSVRGLQAAPSPLIHAKKSFHYTHQHDGRNAHQSISWMQAPVQRICEPVYQKAAWQKSLELTSDRYFHALEHIYPTDFCQGRIRINQVLSYPSKNLRDLSLDADFENVNPERLLFLDTETTGLAGGAGTVPFLVGVGFFSENKFRVEQWILPKFGQEGPMLRRLAEYMDSHDALVSYNGKSFDWPLLRSRFILNRIPLPKSKPHLDVLHCARRILRHRICEQDGQKRMSMRLTDVEQSLLGFTRQEDIPGSLIPARYFAFLRHGHGQVLDAVLEHHRRDVVSLAAVLGELLRRLDDVASNTLAADKLAVAQLLVRGQRKDSAWRFVREAMNQKSGDLRFQATMLASKILLEQKDHQMAAHCLKMSLEPSIDRNSMAPQLEARIHLTLAKIYEHRLRDYKQALRYAEKSGSAETRQANMQRIHRISEKQARCETRVL